MRILRLAGSPPIASRSTCLRQRVGERLAPAGRRSVRRQVLGLRGYAGMLKPSIDPVIRRRLSGDAGLLPASLHALRAQHSPDFAPAPFTHARCRV
ncbi:MAG TPA: hypothetical protein VEC01_20555 [Noviherbaspirillum sp.]|uniref:hypothetical protein n=1 Tax=Noviherbaspirillum sp. TaxID=1926288 RepID=UPI002D26CFFB|nr:hypothetical protein [Noviherbaspirillum sp.]HYD97725.1 hypothetical protein [Noviherbaspirillum sp.]